MFGQSGHWPKVYQTKYFEFFYTNWHGDRAQKLNMQNYLLIGTIGGVAGSALLGSALLGNQLETTYVTNTFVIIFFTFIPLHYIVKTPSQPKLNSTSTLHNLSWVRHKNDFA